jgi:hypothetical protein
VTYDRYLRAVADDLVDRFHLHPDDAVELIDLNRTLVIDWYAEHASPQAVAATLLRSLRVAMRNPIGHPAATFGALLLLGSGLALLAYAAKNALQPGAEPQPYFDQYAPQTVWT